MGFMLTAPFLQRSFWKRGERDAAALPSFCMLCGLGLLGLGGDFLGEVVVALLQFRKIKKIPMDQALKNVE